MLLRSAPRRRGLAPLEFVLAWPILLCLVVALFTMCRVIQFKFAAAVEARNETWKTRPAADPGRVLHLDTDPMSSEVGHDATVRYAPRSFFGSTTFEGRSKNRAVGRSWESTHVPFEPGQPAFAPHPDEARKIADNTGEGAALALTLRPFKSLLAFDKNPLTAGPGALSEAMNGPVRLAGTTLKLSKPALVAGEVAARVFQAIAYARLRFREARMWGRVANLMSLAREGIDNLDRAARGRPVGWPGNMPGRIRSATP